MKNKKFKRFWLLPSKIWVTVFFFEGETKLRSAPQGAAAAFDFAQAATFQSIQEARIFVFRGGGGGGGALKESNR